MARTPRRTARGFTLIEMMISSTILLVAIVGFIAMVQHVMASNLLSHRRTVGSFARGALLDQLAVTPRRILGEMPPDRWFIDECYDLHSRVVSGNYLRATDYVCPSEAGYQRWLRVTPVDGVPSSYQVAIYVERVGHGCTDLTDPERMARTWDSNCVSADAFIND